MRRKRQQPAEGGAAQNIRVRLIFKNARDVQHPSILRLNVPTIRL